ncbi:MAG TPA: YciI family protein [Moheibacter sp.]|nr:YciI family protein [Moheibacter sp.]
MFKSFIIIISFCLSGEIFSQNLNPDYDKSLADSLQADQYGMKMYVLVILKTGNSKIEDKEKVNELFRGHMENINRLVEENKLIVAGPLGKNDQTYRGIFILDVKTISEAKTLVQTDPAVNSGLLDVEYYEWYGSAALPVYLETAKKITKENP